MADLDAAHTDHVAALFARARQRLLAAGLSSRSSLTATQHQALAFLAHHPGCTVGELAAGLAVSCPAATKLVDRLAAKSLAQRLPGDSDRRQVRVQLSFVGAQALSQVEQARREILEGVFAHLPRARHLGLLRGMEAMLSRLVADADTALSLCFHCGPAHTADCPLNRIHRALAGRDLPHQL